MTVISKEMKLVTFINVFTVDPGNQQRLVLTRTSVPISVPARALR
jgi:hypothetical protein